MKGVAMTTQPLGDLIRIVAVVLLVALVLVLGLLVASARLRRRIVREGQLDPSILEAERAELVAFVGEHSQAQGQTVLLRKYWRSRGLTRAQRYVVLEDLLNRQVLNAAFSNESVEGFFQGVFWNTLHFPVSAVRLSQLNWQKLASGASAGIVANGDVIIVRDSPGAGVASRSPHANLTISQELSAGTAEALIAALRKDAQGLVPGHELREHAESLADSLERDAAEGRWGSVRRTAQSVLEFASNSAGLWASTLAILGAK